MVKIKPQILITNFILRLLVCAIIFGGIYLAFFNHKSTSQNTPLTAVQKVAKLRSELDQTYFTGNQIAAFHGSSPADGYSLSNLITQFNGNYTSLQSSIVMAPNLISSSLRLNIKTILSQEIASLNSYRAADNVFGQIISYDPSTDLALSIPSENAELDTRIQAAIKGLSGVYSNQTTVSNSDNLSVQGDNGDQVVSATTQTIINNELNCLKNIQEQISANKTSAIQPAIDNCVSSYSKVRSQAISNELSVSFNKEYVSAMKNSVIPVLSKLDMIIDSGLKTKPSSGQHS
jgi:hypothetical protein